MKKHVFILFLLFFGAAVINSCLRDDSETGDGNVATDFFGYSGTDNAMQWITSLVKQKNDSAEFVSAFVEQHGYPLWNKAYRFRMDERTVYAVPVTNGKNVGAIWFFDLNSVPGIFFSPALMLWENWKHRHGCSIISTCNCRTMYLPPTASR